jgi:hypothetical protein
VEQNKDSFIDAVKEKTGNIDIDALKQKASDL